MFDCYSRIVQLCGVRVDDREQHNEWLSLREDSVHEGYVRDVEKGRRDSGLVSGDRRIDRRAPIDGEQGRVDARRCRTIPVRKASLNA